ncbi:hypothetical protein B0I37DRAFT_371451 [Chaetomium sp. MPI-CAGE-AT-0009]|nr:hypothetical protein B0I37DRAFT_371451 [Chaetomium sp. MPI-CAGE-AT-0009]
MPYAPSHFLRGKIWDYHVLAAVRGDPTRGSTIFKAEVVPHENTTTINVPRWSVMLPVICMSSKSSISFCSCSCPVWKLDARSRSLLASKEYLAFEKLAGNQ